MRALAPALACLLLAATVHAASDDLLLGPSAITVVDRAKSKVKVHASWSDAIGTPAPGDATLRIAGGPGEGDSGVILLPAERWTVRKKGKILRYADPTGSAGGIRSIVLRSGDDGGRMTIKGGSQHWAFRLDGPQTRLAAILILGGRRWCAEIPEANLEHGQGRVRGRSETAPAACPCIDDFESTWVAIQTVVFERHGCTSVLCHGASPGEGDLDLRPESAYAALVGMASAADPNLLLVKPGDSQASLLWQKLAARTLGGIDIPNSPMPLGDQPALSEDELRAIERWIYSGAPETGVVAETTELLASCLPPPDPQKIPPPEPPTADEGVQLYSPPWAIAANGEGEVCFAVPYDFSATIPQEHRFPCPDDWGGPTEECFAYGRIELTQDPNSHHSILRTYRGAYGLGDPGWGTYTCHGGASDGQSCDPTALDVAAPLGGDCGERSACAGTVQPSIACIGYGPADLSLGASLLVGADSANAPSIVISTEPVFAIGYPLGVANVQPVRGVLVVNSHAFNVAAEPTTNEQWLHLYFPDPTARDYRIEDLFDADDIFIQNVPPFEEREYCKTRTFAKGTRLFELFSHTHKRGRLFRVWEPPIAAECTSRTGTCLPESTEPILLTTDYSDPDHVIFDPPLALTSDDPAMRRVKFCAIYDNGKTDPEDVKRRSTTPPLGTVCSASELVCTGGPSKGLSCSDDTQCPDGACDACPLRGGVTTEDEMFILLGAYYCPEDSDCYSPLLP